MNSHQLLQHMKKKINSPRYELDYYINSSNGKKK